MLVRPFKCPQCLSAFRTESGMKWHLAHKHEVPAAVDAICKDYKAKMEDLQVQNARLRQELDETTRRLQSTQRDLLSEVAAKEKSYRDNQDLVDFSTKLIAYATLLRLSLEVRCNVNLPNPLPGWLDEWKAKRRGSESNTTADKQTGSARPAIIDRSLPW